MKPIPLAGRSNIACWSRELSRECKGRSICGGKVGSSCNFVHILEISANPGTNTKIPPSELRFLW